MPDRCEPFKNVSTFIFKQLKTFFNKAGWQGVKTAGGWNKILQFAAVVLLFDMKEFMATLIIFYHGRIKENMEMLRKAYVPDNK